MGSQSNAISVNNSVVSASQTERIAILRQALDRQGIVSASNSHYDLLSPTPVSAHQTQVYPTPDTTTPANDLPQSGTDDEDHGVYL